MHDIELPQNFTIKSHLVQTSAEFFFFQPQVEPRGCGIDNNTFHRQRCVVMTCLLVSASGYRGTYMSAHDSLNLLNELGKRDKMRGWPTFLSLFRNELNKFNNTRARMLDSIYHMTLRVL